MEAESFEKYRQENSRYYVNGNLSEYLNRLLTEKKLVKSSVIRKTELSEVFCYQIFSGLRKPSRDALLCICAAMELTLEETQTLLKANGFAMLYPKNERDSVVIVGFRNRLTVSQINNVLYDNGYNTLT